TKNKVLKGRGGSENQNLVSSTHVMWLTTAYNSSFGGSTLFWLPEHAIHVTYTGTHMHTLKKKKNAKKKTTTNTNKIKIKIIILHAFHSCSPIHQLGVWFAEDKCF
ncbi:hypothetical protein ACQP3J_27900, partial [Escherichia coli]